MERKEAGMERKTEAEIGVREEIRWVGREGKGMRRSWGKSKVRVGGEEEGQLYISTADTPEMARIKTSVDSFDRIYEAIAWLSQHEIRRNGIKNSGSKATCKGEEGCKNASRHRQ